MDEEDQALFNEASSHMSMSENNQNVEYDYVSNSFEGDGFINLRGSEDQAMEQEYQTKVELFRVDHLEE